MDNVLLVALAIAVIGLGLIAAALAGRDRWDHRTARQLASVERKLDAVLGHLGVDVDELSYPEVERLLGEGKTVRAIKEYRKVTGAGLADAKAEVERLERRRVSRSAPAAANTPAPNSPAPNSPAPDAPAAATAASGPADATSVPVDKAPVPEAETAGAQPDETALPAGATQTATTPNAAR
ncbi:hypothetical protein [Cryptosporangium japonicum]|uniref:Ribosomal protein L7/L12 C-terminal domain-containing protein n=1 Tax=Cryptosporangium japonicum TaxID=80872 RepID=A0ABN0V0T1_9ACTN